MIRKGKYRHFKGNEYEVIDVCRHSETLQDMVVYRALYGEHGLWVRPLKMFEEMVERDGKTFRRFEYIGESNELAKGIDHISMKCLKEDEDRIKEFYLDGLGFSLFRSFQKGFIIDTGSGHIEFIYGDRNDVKGTIGHFALNCKSPIECIERVEKYGYGVIKMPYAVDLDGYKAEVAFVYGPLGEEIEFFHER